MKAKDITNKQIFEAAAQVAKDLKFNDWAVDFGAGTDSKKLEDLGIAAFRDGAQWVLDKIKGVDLTDIEDGRWQAYIRETTEWPEEEGEK